ALYLGLARWLWHRDLALRPLAEAFLALAAVFLILAVPFAFAGHATAAAWALEGAGLVWIGVRQRRILARLAGSALLLGAGVAFGIMAGPTPGNLPVLNSRFLGSAAIAVGSLLAGHLLSKARGTQRAWEDAFEWGLLAWGLLWSFGAVLAEIEGHVSPPSVEYAMLFGASAGGCLIGLLARRLNWRAMILAVMPIGPLLWISVVPAFIDSPAVGPFRDLGWLAWPVVVAGSYLLVFWFESVWPSAAVKAWHAGTTWLFVLLATWAAAAAARELVPETPTWSSTIWCVVPAMILLALVRAGNSTLAWPLRRFPSLYAGPIAGALMLPILIWVIWACVQRGAPAPLPYVPLLNPLELTQAFGLIAGFAWWKRQHAGREASDVISGAMRPLLAVLAFLASNMVVGRIVHFYLRVPFDADDLMRSYVFQAGISILWGLTAGALMTLARLRLDRAVWTMGAALLAALILKLFVVDLGNAGGVARIVSFLATGILILVIGYFAPVPPKTERAA
ncbi:MAG: DUF2339 domain-containing protein, partial [Vicinamibacterales bacterium]